MTTAEILAGLTSLARRLEISDGERETAVLVREAIAVIEDRGLRSRTLNMALDLCEGRRKCDYDDAYESEVVVRQAQDFYDFLNPKED